MGTDSYRPLVGGQSAIAGFIGRDWESENTEGGYRVSWSGGYRLELLADGRHDIFPRRRDIFITPDAAWSRPVVLIGEEGSGETSLLHWARALAAAQGAPNAFASADLSAFTGTSLVELADFLLKALGSNETLRDVRGLQRALSSRPKGGAMVLWLRVDRLAPVLASTLLGHLRHGLEGEDPETALRDVSLALMGRDERAFESEPFSSIAPVVQMCRHPRFTVNELDLLLRRHSRSGTGPDPAPQDQVNPDAHAMHRLTGGQPLLTQLFLARLGPTDGASAMPGVYGQLRDAPPEVLISWQKRLADMINRDRRIMSAVRDLVGGHEYRVGPSTIPGAAPIFTRSLCLSGWLSAGFAKDGTTEVWRFSDLHRYWAQPVLRHPERFKVPGSAR